MEKNIRKKVIFIIFLVVLGIILLSVKVEAAELEYTDFSAAQYEMSLDGNKSELKITGIKPDYDINTEYYYVVTPNNTKPEIPSKDNGGVDTAEAGERLGTFTVNADENYIYSDELSKYVELNQDLYLWIIQSKHKEDGNTEWKFVVEGKELERPELPQLNIIMQHFYMSSGATGTSMYFNYPSATENRKFTLKIGKVTDSSILADLKDNKPNGLANLLAYAKENEPVYSEELTATSTTGYKSDSSLFDGNQLLENRAFYYIYVKFDDEGGKYYPIEGVNLGKALIIEEGTWDLIGITLDDIDLTNMPSSGGTGGTGTQQSGGGSTKTPYTRLPKAGVATIAIVSIFGVVFAVFFYKKYNKYKGIK